MYDLTTLQKEANSRYGFSAEKTLDIAQSLYEKKFITYPRTGSRYISEDVAEEIPALIGNMTRYPRFAEYAGLMDTASLSRRSVDNEKIADHHALLPTENLPPNWMPTTASSMRWSRGGCSKPFPGPA